MAPNQIACQIAGAAASGASDAIAIHDEETIPDRYTVGKVFDKFLIMIPAHAAASSDHEACSAESETAGADTNYPNPDARSLFQILHHLGAESAVGAKLPAHDDDIIKIPRMQEFAGHLDQYATTGLNRIRFRRHYRPAAKLLFVPFRVVGCQAKLVDEEREGRKGEVRREYEADRKPRRFDQLLSV